MQYLLPGRQVIPSSGASRFPFRVLHGKQHEMGYLLAGFSESDFPPEIRRFPRVKFISGQEVSSIGSIPDQIQVGILNANLDTDDREWIEAQLTRAGIPPQNIIVEKNPRIWTGWFRREFNIPGSIANPGAIPPAITLIVGFQPDSSVYIPGANIVWWPNAERYDCAHLPPGTVAVFVSHAVGPITRREIEVEALRRGLRLISFNGRDELVSRLGEEAELTRRRTLPKVLVLGVKMSGLPEIRFNPLYRCYSINETARLTAFPPLTQLVVMATRHANPDTVLRMKQLAAGMGAKFIELIGGTRSVKRWLSRNGDDQERQIMHPELESTQDCVTSGDSAETKVSEQAEITDQEGLAEEQTSAPADGTLKEFIKRYWAETGGSPKLLFKKAQEVGRTTTMASISGAKQILIHKDGWIPPSGNGPVRGFAPRAIAPQTSPNDGAAADLIKQGISKINEGLQLIGQGLMTVNGMESRLKVLEPLYTAFQQAVASGLSQKL